MTAGRAGKQVLMEIPDQLTSYMKAVGQKPKPRPQLQREWTVDAQVWSRPPQPTAPAPGAPRVLQPAAAPLRALLSTRLPRQQCPLRTRQRTLLSCLLDPCCTRRISGGAPTPPKARNADLPRPARSARRPSASPRCVRLPPSGQLRGPLWHRSRRPRAPRLRRPTKRTCPRGERAPPAPPPLCERSAPGCARAPPLPGLVQHVRLRVPLRDPDELPAGVGKTRRAAPGRRASKTSLKLTERRNYWMRDAAAPLTVGARRGPGGRRSGTPARASPIISTTTTRRRRGCCARRPAGPRFAAPETPADVPWTGATSSGAAAAAAIYPLSTLE
jgi:hypothetical protein